MREILERIIWHFFLQTGADRQCAGACDRDRVTIRFRLGDSIGAEHTAGAGAVVNQNRLVQQFRHPLTDCARDDVIRPACRKWNDKLDRLYGKFLRAGGICQDECNHSEKDLQASHRALARSILLVPCRHQGYLMGSTEQCSARMNGGKETGPDVDRQQTEKAPEMILRSTLTSPYGRKVRMAADILGLSRRINVVPADPLDEADALRQQNPLGKM